MHIRLDSRLAWKASGKFDRATEELRIVKQVFKDRPELVLLDVVMRYTHWRARKRIEGLSARVVSCHCQHQVSTVTA